MDTNLILRTGATDLTGDETLTSVLVGPMTQPLWLHVYAPSITGGGDTLDVELEFCTAAAPTTEVYNMNMKQIVAAAGHFAIPFFTLLENLQVKLNITDTGGSGFSAGAVKVWIDTSNRYTNVKS